MTREEFERIKKAEKEHLRKLKKLKEVHRQLERQKKVTKAITDMTSSVQEKYDVHADMMDQLATESALNEARLEIAMESSEKADREAQAQRDENDLAKLRAKDRIRQLKEATEGSSSAETTRSDKSAKGTASADGKTKASSSSSEKKSNPDLPEKTIGRMKL